MTKRLALGVLIGGLIAPHGIRAQRMDLASEVGAVRKEAARNNLALLEYTWTEHTEVLVNGEVRSSTAATCRYNRNGELSKTPMSEGDGKRDPNAVSKRHRERKKAEMQDYIERAVSLIHNYVPPKPDQLQYVLDNGRASIAQSQAGKSQIRFNGYFKDGDSIMFTYDPVTRLLLRADITSTLGEKKDPVTLEAIFETLPDGVNHVASTTLNAPKKKVQVKTRNAMYKKAAD